MKKFVIKPKIIFDNNPLAYIRMMEEKRFFVIADPFLFKNKLINKITEEIGERDCKIYSDIIPDPPLESVAKCIKEMTLYNPDCVIAVGGGSAIDTAKAVIFYGKSRQLKFVAIPTTSGTGSEVTAFSVITDTKKGVKYPLVSDKMLPDVAILDTDFVKSIPPSIVADTGMDVLVHAIEAYVSTASNEFSDAFAEKAIKLTWNNLYKSYSLPNDLEAKDKMHKASLMAGLAFNSASLGLNHALAHNLGARLKIPHGRVNAMLLPRIIEYNSGVKSYNCTDVHKCAEKYAQIAKILGFDGNNTKILVRKLVAEVEKYIKKLNLPLDFKQCKVELLYEDAGAVAEGTLKDNCINTNPKQVKREDVEEIINCLR
ncbi:MAG: iron-containing alcohol dehydrogenase [Clostridia bacterium]|nr:iron-containing alcohol dehydrogenase [Clostridia bacterium]